MNPGNAFKKRHFTTYISSVFVSSIGDGMQFIAMSWFILELTGRASAMGWLLVIGSLPGILFPWIGVYVDRWNKKRICMAMDWIRAVCIGVVPLSYYTGVLEIWMIYAVVFLAAVMERFHLPSSLSLLQQSFPKDRLLAANSYGSMADQVGLLVGAALGGVITGWFSPPAAMLCNALSFLLSGLLMTLFPYRPVQEKHQEASAGAVRQGMTAEFREGLSYVLRLRALYVIILSQLFMLTVLNGCNTLLPVFTTRILSLGAEALGMIDASWAAGAILGGAAVTSVALLSGTRFLQGYVLAICGALTVFALSSSIVQASAGYFFLGMMVTMIRIITDTAIQKTVDPAFMGRVAAAIQSLTSYAGLVLYLTVSYLADVLNIRYIYLAIAAAGLLLVTAWLIRSAMHGREPVKQRRDESSTG
ncbi:MULTISPECIES: MFS transporter [Paenibacillus]|uniref:MFS transporter n=1 Tax=Paenibacillus TaxID=44249 RepID=UPI0022B8DBB7|nr:MFS transporter [Paenibacillus caseinilyticus]MCZ8522859.1 MFS transporter [Paenibacillus caseinilyticus]